MKASKFAIAGCLAVSLSGCVGQEFYVRQSVSYDQYQRDTTACGTKATQEVSASNQVGWMPYVGIYTVDANDGLRQQSFDICMRDKGYKKMELPGCSANAAEAHKSGFGSAARLEQKMRVSEQSCFVLSPKGERLLYSPE